ncbi:hypothetical protein ACFSCZ_19870 [Siminovitchia sediminis]|uniref:Ankyrin repeat protein n=1 Tax=Siminovitchia sediminis TaxID=1274353 RepID=A0ABW4KRP2_9BACI
MEEKRLVTFAIMNVHDSNNIDQFDQFVPFVKESLLRSSVDTISANDLKNKIFEHFKIDLPISVVNTILRRKLLPKKYVLNTDNILVPNYEKLQDSNFQEIKQKMMEKHEKLIGDIINYSNEKYNEKLEISETEEALESFLEKHQLVLLEASLNSTPATPSRIDEKKDEQIEYIISDFIRHAQNSYSVSFEYLIDILKGTMLTNALYFKEDLSTINMKFKATEIFFDSTFLIYALGYAGQARQEPCIELIDILRSNRAILKVFRHNIEEMIGILEYCKNNLTKRVHDPHGTINNFLDLGYSPADIDRIIFGIEKELNEQFRIKVVETVDYDEHDYVISHEDLDKQLKENMFYRNEFARDRDVQSVSAIMRLRRGLKPYHIEKSRALFVTNNFTFAQTVKKFFFNEEDPKRVPAVLHDSILTNLMWLKSPSKAPDLPRKRLIAETYAATQPSEHLWSRYIETVNIYERTKTVNEEDIVYLLYSQAAREMVMDITMGDAEIISIGTIKEILTERDNREQGRLDEVRMEKEQEITYLKEQLRLSEGQMATALEKQKNKTTVLAQKRAKITTNTIFTVLSIVVGLAIYLNNFEMIKNTYPIISNVIIIGLVIIPTLLGFFNINLLPWKNKINNYLTIFFEKGIQRKYYDNNTNSK